jgi:S-adenosylmethionine hydrolase
LLSVIFAAEPDIKVFELNKDRFFLNPVSRTFHGRDIFAPVAGWLSKGVMPEELGEEITDFARFQNPAPVLEGENEFRGEIIHIDRFGNCITNFDEQLLPAGFHLEIKGRKVTKMQNFYAEAGSENKIFMIMGSANLLEVCAFRGSAAQILEADIGDEVILRLNQ